ncbi:hypothetical protein C8Q80DRAFT_16007 [Daedaleopsis nitida]|nr:hypothetical protein C8Q80DRAFT_16007 [Daedaleopsis nitida]
MLIKSPLPFLLISVSWIVTSTAKSVFVNRTIDDELGDSATGAQPSYLPKGKWNQGTECSGCHIGPSMVDTRQVFDGTWHDSTYDVGGPDHDILATFVGTAVYVYFIVPNTIPQTTTVMNTSFFLDDTFDGLFTHEPSTGSDIAYRVPVYTKDQLPNQQHTLLMRATGTNTSLILFDYLVYTVEETEASITPSTTSTSPGSTAHSSTTPSVDSASPVPVAAIVGGTLGGMCAIILIAAIFVIRRRRSRPDYITSEKPAYFNAYEMHGEGGLDSNNREGITPFLLPSVSSVDRRSSGSSNRLLSSGAAESTTGTRADANTQQQAELLEKIRALEEQMRRLQPREHIPAPAETGRSEPASATVIRTLKDEVASLGRELAMLRSQLTYEGSEPLPQYEEGSH